MFRKHACPSSIWYVFLSVGRNLCHLLLWICWLLQTVLWFHAKNHDIRYQILPYTRTQWGFPQRLSHLLSWITKTLNLALRSSGTQCRAERTAFEPQPSQKPTSHGPGGFSSPPVIGAARNPPRRSAALRCAPLLASSFCLSSPNMPLITLWTPQLASTEMTAPEGKRI